MTAFDRLPATPRRVFLRSPDRPQKWNDFASRLCYHQGEYGDTKAYSDLGNRLKELAEKGNLGGNRLFYLSTPPEVYFDIIEQIGKAGLAKRHLPIPGCVLS